MKANYTHLLFMFLGIIIGTLCGRSEWITIVTLITLCPLILSTLFGLVGWVNVRELGKLAIQLVTCLILVVVTIGTAVCVTLMHLPIFIEGLVVFLIGIAGLLALQASLIQIDNHFKIT